jgi:hypothetical protein
MIEDLTNEKELLPASGVPGLCRLYRVQQPHAQEGFST